MPVQLRGHVLSNALALKHRDRDQEIVASGSHISGKDRVGVIGNVENTRSLFLLPDFGGQKLNTPTQVGNECLQFHWGAVIAQYVSKWGSRLHGFAPAWDDKRKRPYGRASRMPVRPGRRE